MDTLEQLREILQRRIGTPPDQINPDSKLTEIGVDSLLLLDLMFEMEDKFGVKLPNDLPRPETVAELITVFEELKPRDPQ
jgi:acyl carrier protein